MTVCELLYLYKLIGLDLYFKTSLPLGNCVELVINHSISSLLPWNDTQIDKREFHSQPTQRYMLMKTLWMHAVNGIRRHQFDQLVNGPDRPIFLRKINNNIILFSEPTDSYYLNNQIILIILKPKITNLGPKTENWNKIQEILNRYLWNIHSSC